MEDESELILDKVEEEMMAEYEEEDDEEEDNILHMDDLKDLNKNKVSVGCLVIFHHVIEDGYENRVLDVCLTGWRGS